MNHTSAAQTPDDLAKATLAANIAEQEKKAAEARKAVAVAEAEAAAAATKAANELEKARADADKAKFDIDKAKADAGKARADADKAVFDSVKAGLPAPPDPSKYKVDKPAAPTLGATVGRLTYGQAVKLADKIGKKIAGDVQGRTVLADDAKVRTLIALATATKEALLIAKAGLDGQATSLSDRMKNQPATAFAAGTALVIGSLLENVLAYATILRTQYGFATASATTNAEAALTALVLGQLAKPATYVDADGALPQAGSAISGHVAGLRNSITAARGVLVEAARWSRTRREAPPTGADEAAKAASRAANVKAADDMDRLAEALGKAIDEAQKLAAALFVVDAQGNTPLDAAQRGEALAATLAAGTGVVTLTLKVISSDVDTVATDRLFAGFKVFAGNTTVARWKLVDNTGKLVSAGAEMEEQGPTRVVLTGQ